MTATLTQTPDRRVNATLRVKFQARATIQQKCVRRHTSSCYALIVVFRTQSNTIFQRFNRRLEGLQPVSIGSCSAEREAGEGTIGLTRIAVIRLRLLRKISKR